jgi:hypothetical protein
LPVDEEGDESAEALIVPVGKLEHREAVESPAGEGHLAVLAKLLIRQRRAPEPDQDQGVWQGRLAQLKWLMHNGHDPRTCPERLGSSGPSYPRHRGASVITD